MGTEFFPAVKNGRGVTLAPHPLLVSWSRKSRAIPLLPLWVVRLVQSFSACTRVHFTFLLREIWILETPEPRNCKNVPFKSYSHDFKVSFTRSFTVHSMVSWLCLRGLLLLFYVTLAIILHRYNLRHSYKCEGNGDCYIETVVLLYISRNSS